MSSKTPRPYQLAWDWGGETVPLAIFDPDGQYRYWWARAWDPTRPLVNFVLLNPSTADASQPDPTLRRCLGFARQWGYGGVIITNLFAFRATNPQGLQLPADPVGPENDAYLIRAAATADRVITGWGVHGTLHQRAAAVCRLLAPWPLWVLGWTQASHPRHPLYLPRTAVPIPWDGAADSPP